MEVAEPADGHPMVNGEANGVAPPKAPTLSQILDGLPSAKEEEDKEQSSDDESAIIEADEGSVCKVKTLYEGPEKCRCCINWIEEYPDDLRQAIEEQAETKRQALIVRKKKNHGDGKALVLDSIVVQSPLLKKLLGEVFEGYSGITTSLKRLVFKAPFWPFYYKWDRLTEVVQRQQEPDAEAHARLLHKTLKAELRATLTETKDLISNGVITFQNLWALFEPGMDVYHSADGHDRFYRLESCEYRQSQCVKYMVLQVQHVDWDGKGFGYVMDELVILDFRGTRPITELPTFPAVYHPSIDALRAQVVERGRKFESLSGFHYTAYSGMVKWVERTDKERIIKRNVDGRIVVDAESHALFNPDDVTRLSAFDATNLTPSLDVSDDTHFVPPPLPKGPPRPSRTRRTPRSHPDKVDEMAKVQQRDDGSSLTDEQLLLCTPVVRGYCLKIKRWVEFYVDCVQDIRWNDDAFPNLMLPSGYKKMILSFVESQVANKGVFDDIIEGKGQGIIMLLAGTPGVGKTLTAEAVADKLRRPLYMLSAGELGLDAHSVEHSLGMVLDVAAKWDAVLLIDESDVFLEARAAHDLARNKIVAVFLRLLEYYRGIMFMTTNRADTIDPAFQSRIHLSILYPPLDAEARRHIWLRLVEVSKHPNGLGAKEFDWLAHLEMNGRQIKNAVKTAQLLACREDVRLDVEHIRTVLQVTQGSDSVASRQTGSVQSSSKVLKWSILSLVWLVGAGSALSLPWVLGKVGFSGWGQT